MIFPINATYRLTEQVIVNKDNPDHAEYVNNGKESFYRTTVIHGEAIGFSKIGVFDMNNKGESVIVDKIYIAFLKPADDDESVIDFYPPNNVFYNNKDTRNAIRRYIQCNS